MYNVNIVDKILSWRIGHVLRNIKYDIDFNVRDRIVFLNGRVKRYEDYIDIGLKIGSIKWVEGVVNNIIWNEKKKLEKKNTSKKYFLGEYDVIIIGAGIIGSMITRELSKYSLKIAVVERNPDVSQDASKANNGLIHSGLEEKLGKKKTKLCVKGNKMYDKLAEELDIRFKRIGGLWLITPRSLPKIRDKVPEPLYLFILKFILPFIVKLKAIILRIPVRIIWDIDKIFELNPYIVRDVIAAIYVPTIGIIEPYELAIALIENAVENGVKIFFETKVTGFRLKNNRIIGVETDKGVFKTRFVINSAGLYADDIAELAGTREYTIHPRKGTLILFDKSLSRYVNHELVEIELPRPERTKGGCINPTISNHILWGPTAIETPYKEDRSVSKEELETIYRKFGKIVPNMPRKVIRYFAGTRPATFIEDFIIRPSKWVKGFIHVAGIQSPGLTAAPAIASLIIEILKKEGLELIPKRHFKPKRNAIKRFSMLSLEEREKLIKNNPKYGRIICFCELVSEAEIIEAINRMKMIGVKTITLEGIKFRTRAMMGRCQGSFCCLRILKIIAGENNIPLWRNIFKKKPSEIGLGDIKIFLR